MVESDERNYRASVLNMRRVRLLPWAHTALPWMESPELHFTLHRVLTPTNTIIVEVTLTKHCWLAQHF